MRTNDEPTDGTNRPPFINPNTEYVACHFCGEIWSAEVADGFDLSRDGEMYPDMVPVCPEHRGCR